MGNRQKQAGGMVMRIALILFLLSIFLGCSTKQGEVRHRRVMEADPIARIASLKQNKPRFHIEIWTDKKRYEIDEELRLYFQSTQDCYLTLIDFGTDGSVKVLFPNRYHQTNFVRGGKTHVIPDSGYGFKLTVQPPPGIERIKAIATTEPLSFFDLNFATEFFPLVERSNTQGMRSTNMALDTLPNLDWTEGSCTISIR